MSTIYYTATSLDGFIADADHSLSWLLTRDVDSAGPMGYDGFIAGVGALAMGARTYRWLQENHPDEWFYDVPVWVFTHRGITSPEGRDVRITAADVADVHREMVEAAAGKDVWLVGGGDLVGQFADRGLLDEVWLQYAPVTLGAGAPVLPRRLELRREERAQTGELACAGFAVVR